MPPGSPNWSPTTRPWRASATRRRVGAHAVAVSVRRGTTDALLAADPDLDVFEAAALGYIDRLRTRLDDGSRAEPSAFASDGFTALHFAAFFGKAEAARSSSRPAPRSTSYSRNDFARPAAPQRRRGPPPRGLPAARRGRRRRERHASSDGLHAAPRAAQQRRRRAGRAVPVGRRRPPRHGRCRRDAGGHRRGRRPPRPRAPAPRGRRGVADRRAQTALGVSRARGSARAPTGGRPSRTSPARPGPR